MSLHSYQIQQLYLGCRDREKQKNKQNSTNLSHFSPTFSYHTVLLGLGLGNDIAESL
jgi:hypothetical protein